MAKKSSHVHKLKRHKYPSGNAVYFCTLPDCHFKIDVPLALGKRTLCNICDREFFMNEYTIKLAKPHCVDCGRVKVKDEEGKDRYVKKINNDVFTGIALESNKDLRERLDAATSIEDDI